MSDPSNVTRIDHEGRELYLIGTAHISQQSVEEVRSTILSLRPDTVCVELDTTRHAGLIDDSAWRRLDIEKAIRERRVVFMLAGLALSAYQKKMGDKLGVRPGAELLSALHAAKEVGAEVVLADRDVQITLKRAWRGLSAREKAQLLGVVSVPFDKNPELDVELTAERVEQLKNNKTMTDLLTEMASAFPGIKRPLIDERDLYLISKLREAAGQRVVGVVGAGHVPGMVANLNTPVDRKELETLPPPTVRQRVLPFLIPSVMLMALAAGYFGHSLPFFLHLLYAWALSTSTLGFLLALVARAKPLTLLGVAVFAPFLTLVPGKQLGRLAGLLELRQGAPSGADKRAVRDDILSFRGLYANRFTRIALVSILASFGGTLGSWVGASWVLLALL